VTAYDQTGLVLNSNTANVDLLPAGQRMAVVKTMVFAGSKTVDKLGITLTNPGQPRSAAKSQAPLQQTQVTITHYKEEAIVSGLISNSMGVGVTGVTFSALVFDAGGQIVGAGEDASNRYFIPASGQTAVAMKVNARDTGVRAEIFPIIQAVGPALPVIANLKPLVLSSAGFNQNPEKTTDISVTFVVENPNLGQAISGANWEVALYSETGALLSTSSSGNFNQLSVLYPNSKTCKIAYLNVPKESHVAKAVVQMDLGQSNEVAGQSHLQVEKIAYFATPLPRVTGQILNSGTKEFTTVNVDAVVYDESGNIVGSGSNRLERIMANNQIPIEIPVTMIAAFSGTPARVEIYPHIDTLETNP